MKIYRDGKDQPYIDWAVGTNGFKRAWIQRRGPDKNWAECPESRYLNVVRVEGLHTGPSGNATDFPIYSDLSDEQILIAFVHAVSAISGSKLNAD